MKELVKPLKIEKEYIDVQAYCEGGNSGSTCTTHVRCASNVGRSSCRLFDADEFEGEILF